jgi:hypothetical protein
MNLNAPGTPATVSSITPTQDDRWRVRRSRWNENWQGKPKYSDEICPTATFSATNPTWSDLGSNPGLRARWKPATNRLSYGTTTESYLWFLCHHGMVCSQVADGGDHVKIWRLFAKKIKSSRGRPTVGCSAASGLDVGLTTRLEK